MQITVKPEFVRVATGVFLIKRTSRLLTSIRE